jgi:hypothetical protein
VAVTSEHLAYEIDAAARIVTVVYIGTLSDSEVLAFYTELVADVPDAPTYDFLVDMRYTDWLASPEMIAKLDQLFQHRLTDHLRRIAVVRKTVMLTAKQQEVALKQGLNQRMVRYFTDMGAARAWLVAPA